jgi:methylase of polypeptide subunit release factors
VVQADVLSGLEARLRGHVDLLVCNPPYVATPAEEVGGRDLSAAWAGGPAGMAVTE